MLPTDKKYNVNVNWKVAGTHDTHIANVFIPQVPEENLETVINNVAIDIANVVDAMGSTHVEIIVSKVL